MFGKEISEHERVISPGSRPATWVAQIKSLSSYNVYNVRMVSVGDPGSQPVEIGQDIKAINVAESFVYPGTAELGLYVVIWLVGDKFVFWALGS